MFIQDDVTDGDSKPKQELTNNEVTSADIETSQVETTTATLLQHLLSTATHPLPVKTVYQYELEVRLVTYNSRRNMSEQTNVDMPLHVIACCYMPFYVITCPLSFVSSKSFTIQS